MSIQASLYSYLKSQSPITALIGSGDNTRLYMSQAPQKPTVPYMTYFVVGNERPQHMRAASGLAFADFQIDVYAANPVSRSACVEALRGELSGHLSGTWGSDTIRAVYDFRSQDAHELDVEGSESAKFRAIVTFRVAYTETVPTFA